MTAQRRKSKAKPKPQRKRKAAAKSAKRVDVSAEAARIAELLATAPASADYPIPPPAFITGALLAAAGRVWRDTTAHLDALSLFNACDKYLLAAFCVYVAEFVQANEEIIAKGYSVMVKTISGDAMPRVNPAVDRRDTAFKFMVELSKGFGFTPRHMHELVKLRNASDTLPLFAPPPASPTAEDAAPDPAASEWGSLLDEPPATRPN